MGALRFFFGLLLISVTSWIVFIFALRLLFWILSKTVGISIGFRLGGWNCLSDIAVKCKKGALESLSVGEIKLSLCQCSVKLGTGIVSKNLKLQLLISKPEVVLRAPSKSSSSKSSKKAKPRKSSSSKKSSGKGKKLMAVGNIARFLSVSITDLALKTPKASVEVNGIKLDISKDGGSKSNLFVILQILPISVQAIQLLSGSMEKPSAPSICEEFSLSCEFGHDGEAGLVVRNVDINFGEIIVNLNEALLSKNKNPPVDSSQSDSSQSGSSQSGSSQSDKVKESTADSSTTKKPDKKQAAVLALTKHTSIFPEKICFNLPKLDVKFVHREHDIVVENNIKSIQLKSIKSKSTEEVGENTRIDVQLEFSEIHLLRESGSSVLEIMKFGVFSFVNIPVQVSPVKSWQPTSPVKAEIDVKFGGIRSNVIISTLKKLLQLKPTSTGAKKKTVVLQEETSTTIEKPQSTESKAITWKCTVSVPDITIVIYGITDVPMYQLCLQSSYVLANDISSTGPTVHTELGELKFRVADENQECLKESISNVESNSGSLVHIAQVSLDWGKKDMESSEEGGARCKLVLSTDVTGMGIYFTYKHVESLIIIALTIQALFKKPSASKKATQSRPSRSSKPSGKGTRLLKFNLKQCSIRFCGDTSLENTVVADPKRVNYGSQGGRVVISVSDDGTLRTATVLSTVSDECKILKYSLLLDIFRFSLCVNKDKQSTQVELERVRSIYQDHLEEDKPDKKVTLFDMQNAKFVQRSVGHREIAVCSLFSATDISITWEPDMHLSFVELGLKLKALVQNQKAKARGNEHVDNVSSERDVEQKKEVVVVEPGPVNKTKKKESVFAVDVEMLSIYAEAGDGVDAFVQVQSIFSENARIGVLVEGILLSFNEAQILKSGRMQISRIPNVSSSPDPTMPVVTVWDIVIQALDVYICLPFRLELRAIDDVVEEMARALKIVTNATTQLILPKKENPNPKPKKPSSSKFGCVKFFLRKLTADIEEEPMQGWLDEHYNLMKNEAFELGVRLKFFNDYISANQCPKTAETNDSSCERKIQYNGAEIDMQDPSAIQKMEEEIHRQSFQSYYLACQKLKPAEGSGSWREGFQAGFKPSTSRISLFAISGTELDVTVTLIDGGTDGMIEVIKQLDPMRDYPFPLFSATSGRCEGRLVMGQQATAFQPQVSHDVFIGRWRKVRMLRSAAGTTPPMKTYTDLQLNFKTSEVSFGVGYETVLADVSYAFTVALRRANLSKKGPGLIVPPKKEKSLPWWDDMRNYIHGNNSLFISETNWHIQASPDPYEKLDQLQIVSGPMEIQQSDGRIYGCAKEFKIFVTSLESLLNSRSIKIPTIESSPFLDVPVFSIEVLMDWDCDSGYPMNHYLFALPVEGKVREKIFDPFRSTALSLRFDVSLKPPLRSLDKRTTLSASSSAFTVPDGTVNEPHRKADIVSSAPTVSFNVHDLAWLAKFGSLMVLPPYKIRLFARFPRFAVPRIPRSGNLPLDRVMTETMFRLDISPTCIKYKTFAEDDPAKGLTFTTTKFKVEVCSSRGKQKFTFDCMREPLDLVYLGLDLHLLKAFLNKEDSTSVTKVGQTSQSASMEQVPSEKSSSMSGCSEKHPDEGFFMSSDYFTIRKQSPKADAESLVAWQETGKKNLGTTYVRTKTEKVSESDEQAESDPSDDDGYSVVIADNCQRIFLYGLKILLNIENRDAVRSFGAGLAKAFEPRKACASRQYAQRKLLEEKQKLSEPEMPQEDALKSSSTNNAVPSSSQQVETSGSDSSVSQAAGMENSSTAAVVPKVDDSEEEGTRHFMVNIIEPQFNLHSEEANGRFLLAAASGRVLARSFHSVLRVGSEVIEKALGNESVHVPEGGHDMTLTRMEFSVMLEHVQAHVAPTDVDLGAGVQWLPKIRKKSSQKVKRTGALLERVFTPCDMYLRFTRHKSGTPELKVKPLKDLSFNSQSITMSMTSRQFQVMLDVLTNLLFARAPKPRKSCFTCPGEDDEDEGEEADAVVPSGVEEVELAKITLEQKEWEHKFILNDIKKLSLHCDTSGDNLEKEGDWWMVNGGKSILVQGLKKELVDVKKLRKEATAALRVTMQKAAQQRLMEKEKNKSPSCAMRVSVQVTKLAWSMLMDGKPFAEVEINDMIYDYDRDYTDIGVALFTTKSIIIRNCLANAKSDTLLSAWNPPPEWGKKVLLRVDAKQGAPRGGNSVLELLQVDVYPLKIHLTEAMYRMVWGYLFPSEDQDSQKRKEVWKVSTIAGARRAKKSFDVTAAFSLVSKDPEGSHKSSASITDLPTDSPKSSKLPGSGLRRTSSFDRMEDAVAESIATELLMQAQSSKMDLLDPIEQQKDAKSAKAGRPSLDDKKVVKPIDEKKTRPPKLIEFRNIKISQVELLLTYEGSRFVVSDLKLLMDTFHRVEFTGTWRRLISRVKKHVIWGVLKSVTGMQGKKFKDKGHSQQPTLTAAPDGEFHLSDDQGDKAAFLKRSADGAGDGFVTSVKGLFTNQRRKAKQFVLRTMRGEGEGDQQGQLSEGEAEISPFARQLTITQAKKLIRKHTKKFEKGSVDLDKDPSSPSNPTAYESDSSSGSELVEELNRIQK
ncbi:hypersensitive to Pi starvation 4, SABRE [Hibiscus trionum]|uniref:Hypersensitive to Pi starvation 4, SABRE n=1 Tax=Hibiscus trionum TaxID=183268 RepID=A0A9W7M773_HIBTR|nr:hypersensitive to Pi starvation 4, SABRE [Hibiscus trionum]